MEDSALKRDLEGLAKGLDLNLQIANALKALDRQADKILELHEQLFYAKKYSDHHALAEAENLELREALGKLASSISADASERTMKAAEEARARVERPR